MHEDAPVGSDSCRLEAYSDRKSRVQVSHAFFFSLHRDELLGPATPSAGMSKNTRISSKAVSGAPLCHTDTRPVALAGGESGRGRLAKIRLVPSGSRLPLVSTHPDHEQLDYQNGRRNL